MSILDQELKMQIQEVGEFILQQGISFLTREVVTPVPWFINFTPDEENYRLQIILRRDTEDSGEWYFLLFNEGEYLCLLVFTDNKGKELEKWRLEKLRLNNCSVAHALAVSLSDEFDKEFDIANPQPSDHSRQ